MKRLSRNMTLMFLATLGCLMLTDFAFAAEQADKSSKAASTKPKVINLWKDGAPGAKGTMARDTPQLWIYLPEKDKANGAAVVICPGGGYGGLAIDHEGHQFARWFNSFGVAAFVCKYRVSPYRHPIPLGDAQRAIRTVRQNAKAYGIDPGRVGVMGFSAGGHLASTTGTHFDAGKADAKDPIDRQSSRPDFLMLGYPVITMTDPYTHKGSRNNLLGKNPTPEMIDKLSSEKQVTKATPATFIFQTNQDRAVPAENAVKFYLALRKAGVPAELHIYRNGRHGVGMAKGDPVVASWTRRLQDWLRTSGYLTAKKRAAVKGKVSVDGKPVNFGWVLFEPADHASPRVAAGLSNGSYTLPESQGPTVGEHAVTIVDNRIGWRHDSPDTMVGCLLFDRESPDSQPFKLTLKAGSNNQAFVIRTK